MAYPTIGPPSARAMIENRDSLDFSRLCSARPSVVCDNLRTGSNTPTQSTEAWSNLTGRAAPSATGAPDIAYDSADGYVVQYGVGGTWTFAGGVWKNITSSLSSSPPPGGAYLTYDGADGYVLAIVLAAHSIQNWAYHQGRWTNLTVHCVPYSSCGAGGFPYSGVMTYDAADGYVLADFQIDGNTQSTWTYKNGTWTQLDYNYSNGPAIFYTPALSSISYDGALGRVIGWQGTTLSSNLPAGNSTWMWNGSRWLNDSQNISGAPPARFGGSLAYDNGSGYVLLFGGWNWTTQQYNNCEYYGFNCTGSAYSDTWGFRNGTWFNLSAVAGSPGPMASPLLISDPADDGILEFEGVACGECRVAPGPQYNYTWFWGPSNATPIIDVQPAASPDPVDAGATVDFNVSYEGGSLPVSFSWLFGDGATSISQDPTHVFANAGTYQVRVWVNDSNGHSGEGSINVSVRSALALVANATPNPTDVDLPVTFNATGFGGSLFANSTNFTWDFGDGSAAFGPNQTHIYSHVGSFLVNVTLTDAGGGNVTRSLTVQVNPALIVDTINANPNPADLGKPVNFTSNVSGGTLPYTYSWTFGDGGTGGNLSAITHIFTTNGPFITSLQVRDAGDGITTSSLNITIALNASISSNASIGASPLTVAFGSDVEGGAPGYSYDWTFGDGATTGEANPVHEFGTPGDYRVLFSVTDQRGNSIQRSLDVEVAPGGGALGLKLQASATQVPIGAVVGISASPSGGEGAYTFGWGPLPAGCYAGGLVTMNCTFAASGNYNVTAFVTDSRGAGAEANLSVQVGDTGGGKPNHISSPGPASLDESEEFLALGIGLIALAMLVAIGIFLQRRGRPPKRKPVTGPYADYSLNGAPSNHPSDMREGGTASDGQR
jgi:PKD repeat protein